MRLIEVTYEVRETFKLALNVPDDASVSEIFEAAERAMGDDMFFECVDEVGDNHPIVKGIAPANPDRFVYTYIVREDGSLDDYEEGE